MCTRTGALSTIIHRLASEPLPLSCLQSHNVCLGQFTSNKQYFTPIIGEDCKHTSHFTLVVHSTTQNDERGTGFRQVPLAGHLQMTEVYQFVLYEYKTCIQTLHQHKQYTTEGLTEHTDKHLVWTLGLNTHLQCNHGNKDPFTNRHYTSPTYTE